MPPDDALSRVRNLRKKIECSKIILLLQRTKNVQETFLERPKGLLIALILTYPILPNRLRRDRSFLISVISRASSATRDN